MDPRYLVQLAVIIELGSLSRAAERLNLTQPTLTRNIKIIEDRTGSPVLMRERYGVAGTELGKQLAELGREIRDQTNKSRDLITSWQAGLQGELRVGFGAHIAQAFCAEFLQRSIEAKWPYVFHSYTGIISAHFSALATGDRDMVIGPDPARMPNISLTRIPLFSTELGFIVGAHSPLIHKPDLKLEDLVNERWFSPGARSGAVNDIMTMEQAKLSKPIVFSAYAYGDSSQSIELLDNSDFVAPMPIELFHAITKGKSKCRIVRATKPTMRKVSAWVRTSEADRPELLHFLDETRALFEEHLPAECLDFNRAEEVFSSQA